MEYSQISLLWSGVGTFAGSRGFLIRSTGGVHVTVKCNFRKSDFEPSSNGPTTAVRGEDDDVE